MRKPKNSFKRWSEEELETICEAVRRGTKPRNVKLYRSINAIYKKMSEARSDPYRTLTRGDIEKYADVQPEPNERERHYKFCPYCGEQLL